MTGQWKILLIGIIIVGSGCAANITLDSPPLFTGETYRQVSTVKVGHRYYCSAAAIECEVLVEKIRDDGFIVHRISQPKQSLYVGPLPSLFWEIAK